MNGIDRSARHRVGILFATALLSSCANLNTIERRTMLPADNGQKAVAVHLDAKQRLVVSHSSGIYCAEPNPDALSAAASGQGASASVADKGSGAISLSAQESAGSIGLRTQSIQLQREVFYRLCEAYYNGGISQVQLGTLLSRSQDLTAVVLAVEQLTGAVAANQVILTGSAGSSSVASLTANQQALEAAREAEKTSNERLAAAQKAKDDHLPNAAIAEQALKNAEDALTAERAKTPRNDAEINRLNEVRAGKEAENVAAKAKTEELVRNLEQAKLNHDDAKKLRETIEAIQSSSVAAASSNATGSGGFTVVSPRREMSPDATKEIAAAVKEMVIKALDGNDILPTCLGVLGWAAEEEQAVADITAAAEAARSRSEPKTNARIVSSLESALERLDADSRRSARDEARAACLKIIANATASL